ncbi:tRNA (cytosine(38)-C(5))-methyltransferase isoform X2 [Hyla sarda]|uniref:tRNA (cytosine(38)-C(5))-methyltransferase isoform X2 n=1 Tax=Hyla sarda TaxID=327740 RepID=UPI0024C46D69|nr:tRNA (cytosine(38)-C(5))-methyltransferase isoform X2 [Hyla sarda]
MAPLRVLELYSGIGGMHCGLAECGVSAEVVAAVDVNTTANEVYKHNFPNTPLWPKSIEGISLKELDSLSFDMILMSPPCQPFTRIGLQGDVSDPRAKSFLYVLEILPRLRKTPSYILLENVKGFESSEARDTMIRTLESCGYIYQEFLLSPPCLGIPNSRLRYFLIAKLQAEQFAFQTTNKILEAFPCTNTSELGRSSSALCSEGNVQTDADQKRLLSPNQGPEGAFLYKLETAEELERKMNQDNDPSVQRLQDFLEENVEISQYLLPPKSLLRYALILDIVKPTCRRSTCFTKGYGHYVEGTGSILQAAADVEISSAYNSLETLSDEEKLDKLSALQLRYFTPREIANLHGFPAAFGFPDKITTKQRYRLLGNSLNVHIVAKLIALMLQAPAARHRVTS